MCHIEGVTPGKPVVPEDKIIITQKDVEDAIRFLNDDAQIDFVSVGCPHCSMKEMETIANLLKGRRSARRPG